MIVNSLSNAVCLLQVQMFREANFEAWITEMLPSWITREECQDCDLQPVESSALLRLMADSGKRLLEYSSIVYLSAHECNTVIIHELNKILLVHKYSLPKYSIYNTRFMGLDDWFVQAVALVEYLGLRRTRWQGIGGNYIMRTLMICTSNPILFGWSNREEWDGRGMLHVWGWGEVPTGFWWRNLKERGQLEDPGVDGRIY